MTATNTDEIHRKLAALTAIEERKTRLSTPLFVLASIVYIGGYGLLWWLGWKIAVAVFLINFGTLLQADANRQ